MMRKTILSALAALLASASVAAARPSTLDMSCGEAAATVARAGAIVLSTGTHTYDRFVAHNGYCLPGQEVRRALAPTIDNPYCTVGYVCQEREPLYRNH
jgi:hypothetical protein